MLEVERDKLSEPECHSHRGRCHQREAKHGDHHLSLKIHKDGMEEAGCCGEGGGVG